MLKIDKSLKDSLIADCITNLTWEYDLITGETNTAEGVINSLGYSRFDIKENISFWTSLVHPDDIENLSKAFNKVIEGKSDYFSAQYRIKTKYNGYKWIKSEGKALKNNENKTIYLAGFHINITTAKQAEGSEQKYETLFNNVNDIIFLSSVNEDGTPGKFLEVNNMATTLLGYSKNEFLNMFSDAIYADKEYSKTYLLFCKEVLHDKKKGLNGNYYNFEVNLLKKDGTILPVEINTNIFELDGKVVNLCVMRDISERIKVETKLRAITKRNKEIVEHFPLGVVIYEEGIITYVNKLGLKLIGAKSTEEVLNRPMLDFVVPPYREISIERQILIESGYNVDCAEMDLYRVDGNIFIGEVYSAPMASKNNFLGISYIRDITEQKKMIEENKNLLEQIIEYDRLKTEFFSNISHELRTPLNILITSIQLLNSIYNNSKGDLNSFIEAFEKYIDIMKQNCYRLLKLINNIIDLTRLDSGFLQMNFENHNIVEVVENITLSVVDYTKNKGIDLIFDTNVEEKIICCDDDKIERIILNLLSNAIKYTKSNGTIEVIVKDLDNNVQISVKDTGCGIPDKKLGVIFERFRQVDEVLTRRAEGSGIGLSLVKALVEAHNGSIEVHSTVGVGSEFIILLPNILVKNTETYHNPLDNIDDEDQLKKKVERVNIEFSDIYH